MTQAVNSVTQGYTPTFHMPQGNCGSPDQDGLMSVIEEDTNLAVDLYAPIVMPSPPPTFNPLVIAHAIGSFYDVKNGDGTGVWNGRRASLIPTIAGVIRYGEPTTTPDIPHALSVIMAQSVMKNAAVWPAYGYDTSNSYGNCATCLPMGALLAIPATTDLTTLGISTQEGMVIVRAAQKYGVYIVDTAIDPKNSPPAMFFEAQLNNPDAGLQAMATPGSAGGYDLTIIAKNLQLVTNNSAQNPGGPGTHTSMAPPFSD